MFIEDSLANALMLTQKSPQWRDRPNVGASSEFSRLFPLFNALLRFNLYVTSLFSTYCCKLTTGKFARQQRADLSHRPNVVVLVESLGDRVDDDQSVEKAPPPRFENPDERSASGTKRTSS